MTPDDAIKAGAMALFGEKYGDEVRVVSMGEQQDKNTTYSTELCGGTHVKRTGDIGIFKIVNESAVASGVRRIDALTGQAALDYLNNREISLIKTADILKSTPQDVEQRVSSLLSERKSLERELSTLRRKLAAQGNNQSSSDKSSSVNEINGIKFISRSLKDVPAKELKPLVDQLKSDIGSGIITVCANNDGKASIVVGVTNDLTNNFNAVDLVRIGSQAMGGKGGGGRPDMAQAGGPDGSLINQAIKAIEVSLAK